MLPGLSSLAFDSLGGAGGLANNGISSASTGEKFQTISFGNSGNTTTAGPGLGQLAIIGLTAATVAYFFAKSKGGK